MGTLSVVSLWIAVVILSAQCSHDWYYNYYVYATQWPASFCFEDTSNHTKSWKNDDCDRNKNITTWTVHGLWPSVNETYPNYCNGTSCKLKETDILQLEDKMRKFWPSFGGIGDALTFWQHEWCKHGTCAALDPNLRGPYKFFNQVLQLHDKLNLLQNFADHLHILPGKGHCYNYTDVIGKMKSYFNESVIAGCTWDKVSKRQHLAQVEICYTKNFTLACDPSVFAKRKPTQYMGSPSSHLPNIEPCSSKEKICYFPIQHADSARKTG